MEKKFNFYKSGKKNHFRKFIFFFEIFIKSFLKLKYWIKNHIFVIKKFPDFFSNFYNIFYFQKIILEIQKLFFYF